MTSPSFVLQWRKFTFFDKILVGDPSNASISNKEIQGLDIKACTSGRGQILLGDSSGYVHIADRNFTLTSFQAYEVSVSHLKQMKQRNVLISIGNDTEGINPTVKVWNLEGKAPVCVRSIKISYEGKTYLVSCFAVLENLSQMAVGLVNGAVLLIRGDISRDRFTKQKVIHKGNSPVTGLGFRDQLKSVYLFVVTTDTIDCYTTLGKEQKEELEPIGCEFGCATISEPDQEMILGRFEAVYFYVPEGKGASLIFQGQKKMLAWFRGYLIVVEKDTKATNMPSATASQISKMNNVTIYDLKNKFIAWNGQISDVTYIVSEWGSIFLVTGEKQIFQLEEKDTSTKLDLLFKKNLYVVAINLAHSAQYDYSSIIEIFKKYGDHLYGKGDFDGAMTQYLKTIGRLEPSYVIRKFLDAQRIHNLTSYLQELHEKGLANADHTTLLLNCYTKLKDVEKLDQFIKTDKNLNFDVETAIKVCRQASYHEHALYLAKKFQQHEWYLKIQLEDVNNYTDALNYISSLEFFEAEKNMKLYGKVLVNNIPEPTTQLLIKLCTGYEAKAEEALMNNFGEPVPVKAKLKSKPEDFIHIFVNQSKWLTRFLEDMVKFLPGSSTIVYNTLLELYLKANKEAQAEETDHQGVESTNNQKMALELLKRPGANFDLDHALVLTKMYDFKEGVLYLYEKVKLFKEIVQYHMDNNEYANVLACCKKYGDKDPNLWVHVLSYFAQKDDDCQKEIVEILNTIDKKNLLPPLQVIQILSKSKTVTLSVVKDYITRRITAESQMISEDQKQIKKYQEETEKMRTEIQELKTSAKIFQLMKCTACTSPLDLPAVHFLCMHSFHQRCLGDNEKECPVCSASNHAILERKRAYEQSANQHEQFFKMLENSENGFSVVSEYFGRNIFGKVVLLDK